MQDSSTTTKAQRLFVRIIGLFFIIIVLGLNEWTIAKSFTADGALSSLSTKIIRAFDVVMLLIGALIVRFRVPIARQLTRRNVAFAFAGVLVGIVCLEIGSYIAFRYLWGVPAARLGSMQEDNLYIWQPGDTRPLPFAIKPNFEQVFRSLDGQFTSTIQTNNVGMRGTVDYHGEHADIACIGDSFTFGWGVNDGETYCDHLRAQFADQRVLSYGFAGFTTPHYYLYLKRFPERIPDTLVLGLYPDNDFSFDVEDTVLRLDDSGALQSAKLSRRYVQEDGSLGVRQRYETSRVWAIRRAVTSYSYTGKLLYAAWNRLIRMGTAEGSAAVRGASRWAWFSRVAHAQVANPSGRVAGRAPQVDGDVWEAFDKNERIGLEYVEKIHRLMRERGGRLIVLLIPMSADVGRKTPSKNWERYKTWFSNTQIESIDPFVTFVKHRAEGRNPYFPGDGHWAPFGHRLAADMLIEYVKAHPTTTSSAQPRQ